jgi:hypothetical protein
MSDLKLKVRGFTLYLPENIELAEDIDYTLALHIALSKVELEGESKTYVCKQSGDFHLEV